MKRIFLGSALVLSLMLTGCPRQASQPDAQKSDSAPSIVKSETPVVETSARTTKTEPAGEEARKAVELVDELGGQYTLTPGGALRSVVLDSSSLDDAAFELFAGQPELETLQIMNFRELNDSMVEKLDGLKKIRNLRLTNSGITDAAVKTIVRFFPDLRDLDLSSNTLLTDVSLNEIAKLKELERLTLVLCNFSEFGIMDISSLPKLKNLDIRGNMTVGNSGLGFVAKLPALKGLKHRSPAVDDFGMEALVAAKGLDTLEIQDFNITDTSGQYIKQFENLLNLIVFRCQGFGSTGLLELKGMKLGRLTLRDLPSIDDSGMEVFRELTTLKRLYLNELESVSDAGMINLVYLKNLELLDVWEVPVTDASLESISKLTNLNNLALRSTKITDGAVDTLLAMPKLERLTLKENAGLTEEGKKKLRDSKKFKVLDFGEAAPQE